MNRKVYIIIHGTGSTLRDTIKMLSSLSSISAFWYDGIFFLDKKTGILIRKILSDTDDKSPLFTACRKIIIARLLRASFKPERPLKPSNYNTFNEINIIDRFPDFDIPYFPHGRAKSIKRLETEGKKEFISIFNSRNDRQKESFEDFINFLYNNLFDDAGEALSEEAAANKLVMLVGEGDYGKSVVSDLIQLRDMSEAGADLDTISSAIFYAHALANLAKEENEKFRYGIDYDFVFINYHQGLLSILDEFPVPGDIYMADIPVSTIPDIEGDLKVLSQKNYRLIRYEDHHPYTAEQLELLKKLKEEKLIEYFAMSGPLQGNELPQDQLKCGGDMVYESMIMGRKWDNSAMAYLRNCVHGEDLAQERTEEGKLLTDLIKGGTNSIEIIQTVLSCKNDSDIKTKINEKGWVAKIAKEKEEISKIEGKFNEALQLVEVKRPTQDEGISGASMSWGSDMPISGHNSKNDSIKILIALAPSNSKNEPKLKIGKAQEYFSRKFPDIDYLLYCYGSSIMVGRRLNQADFSINLSVLMRKIGTESDGGHSGAAVCSPEKNPFYPKTILGRVDRGNFNLFCRYIRKHITEDLNLKILSVRDISIQQLSKTHKSGILKLTVLLIITFVLGMIVLWLNPDFRIAKIAELNQKDFFVWFGKTHYERTRTEVNNEIEGINE